MKKIWFVTGSSVGLGREIVEAALSAGHSVVATARDPGSLDVLVGQYNEQLLLVKLDVTDTAGWHRATSLALERFGRIDVMVNNAGFGGFGSIENIPLELVHAQLETNFVGALQACKAAMPIMRAQGGGRIMLVSSIGARVATAGAGVYYATKAAVSSLAETLALEAAPFGIQVTAIEPGAMGTRFSQAGSLKVSEFDAAYDATVGATLAMMRSPAWTESAPDPAGHAAMILEAASLERPPARLLAGADAFDYGMGADLRQRESDLELEALSRSATLPARTA